MLFILLFSIENIFTSKYSKNGFQSVFSVFKNITCLNNTFVKKKKKKGKQSLDLLVHYDFQENVISG